MSPIIPGGRGPRISDDAIPGQEEQYQSRETRLPGESPLYYYTLGSLFQQTVPTAYTAGVAPFTGTFYLFPLPGIPQPLNATRIAIPVIVPVPPGALHFLQGALYQYEATDSPDTFRQVPTTQFTINLLSPLQPAPGAKYGNAVFDFGDYEPTIDFTSNFQGLYMGYQVVGNDGVELFTIQQPGAPAGAGFAYSTIPTFSLPLPGNQAIPRSIARSVLTREQTDENFTPAMTFLSAEGARLWGVV